MRSRTWLLGVLAGLLVPVVAHAKLCGANVAGQHVACACGDVVVSDLTLTNDPVTTSVCHGNALMVRAVNAPQGVTIDLNGKTLHGDGHGIGLWLINGGPGGAHVISSGARARIDGFMDGIVAHGNNTVASVQDVVVTNSKRDGVRLDADGFTISNSATQNAGRDGFSLDGKAFQISATQAMNSKRFGYFIKGMNGTIGTAGAGNTAEGSGQAGFNLTGMGHHLVACAAMQGGTDGVRLSGMHFTITGCVADGNGGNGITGTGMDWHLTGNRAMHNAKNGLDVHGAQMSDGGGNQGIGNAGHDQARPATQCAIANATCTTQPAPGAQSKAESQHLAVTAQARHAIHRIAAHVAAGG